MAFEVADCSRKGERNLHIPITVSSLRHAMKPKKKMFLILCQLQRVRIAVLGIPRGN